MTGRDGGAVLVPKARKNCPAFLRAALLEFGRCPARVRPSAPFQRASGTTTNLVPISGFAVFPPRSPVFLVFYSSHALVRFALFEADASVLGPYRRNFSRAFFGVSLGEGVAFRRSPPTFGGPFSIVLLFFAEVLSPPGLVLDSASW